jgi:REP element-mobilizing transposase RayT
MSRGNGRMRIFLDDEDYQQFVFLLGDVVEEFDIRCWNYCIMPNHYHATLQPSGGDLSEAIRRLNGVYAQWWNRRHRHVGHVFQGRYKDQIVQRDAYLLTLSRYVVMNPVRGELASRPDEWEWSSYRATVGLSTPPSFLHTPSTLALFGTGTGAVLQERFAQFVGTEGTEQAIVNRIRSNERIVGDRAFKESIAGASKRRRRTSISSVPKARRVPREP